MNGRVGGPLLPIARGAGRWRARPASGVIERTDYGQVRILLRAATVTKAELAGNNPATPSSAGSRTMRGKPGRLMWTDETARASVVRKRDQSKFMRSGNPLSVQHLYTYSARRHAPGAYL